MMIRPRGTHIIASLDAHGFCRKCHGHALLEGIESKCPNDRNRDSGKTR
jgi:hypothetical protein